MIQNPSINPNPAKLSRVMLTRIVLFPLFLTLVANSAFAADLLTPKPPFQFSAKAGARFDFLEIDTARNRLLAAHTGNASLDIIDLNSGKLIKSVPTGNAQDSAVAGKEYLASVSKPPQVIIIDADSFHLSGSIPLAGPADLITFNPANGLAYVCHDDASELWIVSPSDARITGTLALTSDDPEGTALDASGRHLFQAIKSASTIAAFDLSTNKIIGTYPTAPAQSPHGVTVIPEINALAIAGGNGKLVLMSQADGKILSSADIPNRVDEIAYDAANHLIYCASGLGRIGILSLEEEQLKSLGAIPSQPGCHSIAVNPADHSVWIAYANQSGSYVQQFVKP